MDSKSTAALARQADISVADDGGVQDDDAALLKKINDAVKAANDAEQKVTTAQADLVSHSKAVGLLLLEAKKLHPAVKDFEAFLKRAEGLKLSRAYDLMRLAGGRTTDEEIRKETRERVKKHRSKKLPPGPAPKPEPSVTSTPVTETPEASAERRKAENADLGLSAEQKAAKKSARGLAEFSAAAHTYLPLVTVEADRQKARELVARLTGSKVG